MPYPVLKLAYGLRRRLRELATPMEAYELQIAVGSQLIGLQPLQVMKKAESITLTPEYISVAFKNDGRLDCYKFANFKAVANVQRSICFKNVEGDLPDALVLTHLYLNNTKGIQIVGNVSFKFLENIAQKTTDVLTDFTFSGACLPLCQLLFLFPKLTTLQCSELYKGWEEDLLKVSGTCLTSIRASRVEYKSLLSLKSQELSKILQIQKHLCIDMDCTLPDDEELQSAGENVKSQLLSNELVMLQPGYCSSLGILRIQLQDSTGTVELVFTPSNAEQGGW